MGSNTKKSQPIWEDMISVQKRLSAGLKNIRSGSFFRSTLNAISLAHESEPDLQPVFAVKRVQDGDPYLSEVQVRLIREIALHELQLQPLLERQEKIKSELMDLKRLLKEKVSIKGFALGSVIVVTDQSTQSSHQRLAEQIKRLQIQSAAIETEAKEIQNELTTKQMQLNGK